VSVFPSRAGWLGIPVGLLSTFFAFAFVQGEDAAFLAGAVIAAVGGAVLPYPHRLVAIGIGALLYWLMWHIPQGGADSPLNYIVAYCSAGFGFGAFLTTVFLMLRSRLVEFHR
jgi:hypothetical protein